MLSPEDCFNFKYFKFSPAFKKIMESQKKMFDLSKPVPKAYLGNKDIFKLCESQIKIMESISKMS